MDHSRARKLIRAATLSLLALATTSGVVSMEVMAASPAIAQPDGPGGGSIQGLDPDQPDPPSTPIPTPTPVPPLPVPAP
jgi:hypothetical protein